jgi:hypothetical protein
MEYDLPNNKVLQHYVMFQKIKMKNWVQPLMLPYLVVHMWCPWSLVRIISTHKPIQHLGPTLTFSLQSPKSHI